ncbi:hypothetical protein HNP32_002578 [Brevundimonas bullata]|uniref:Uncharacterized protein n=1 Tax=Brevundimonas bullata TaxID=13160 RepID=A0A7W7IQU4_9CAUL|nr:hypothetical protein [Brevundimonas bullata]MBB4798824.1 hypothetical protein [Brevundimonas bullata]MBB6383784.1 hypothetical protein [Brevundimonas bullata]
MTKKISAKRRMFLALAACAAAILAPQVAAAGPTAGHSYRLRATVPVACWVRPTGTVMAENGRAGSVVEACNSPGGFTVSAQYRPLAASEKAKIVYGDRSMNLSKSGMLELRRSNMATIRTVDYRFDEVELEQPLILALTIQPI